MGTTSVRVLVAGKEDRMDAGELARVDTCGAKRPDRGWTSVIADGAVRGAPGKDRLQASEGLRLVASEQARQWWEPGALKPGSIPSDSDLKHVFLRVVIEEVSGRQAESQEA